MDGGGCLFLVCSSMLFVIPFWKGVQLLKRGEAHRRSLAMMAALLTLKTIPAIILGFFLSVILWRFPQSMIASFVTSFVSILPAVFLTTLIVRYFRPLFWKPTAVAARKLLLWDWLGWGALLMGLLLAEAGESWFGPLFVFIGLAMPSIYPFFARKVVDDVERHKYNQVNGLNQGNSSALRLSGTADQE